MKCSIKSIICLLFVLLTLNNSYAESIQLTDTVFVHEISDIPVIDAIPDDECWLNAEWHNIDQFWIKYGEPLDSSDFSGRFKILWSESENLLYYLIEVNDDIFIDGWPDIQGDYFAFDIIEIFLDQDRSGGLHVFDGSGSVGEQWGTNAENAFAYHINIDLPEGDGYTSECVVNDIAGTDWSTITYPDYSDHFPEIALREFNDKYYWEFSLIVYNDKYYHPLPDYSRVQLMPGDIMGMSVAYCDNDGIDENPKTRDNFIGSVWVAEEDSNDHWMDADDFGVLKLIGNSNDLLVQDDPVEAFEAETIPVIDGDDNDEIWRIHKWQPIGQVWIGYGDKLEPEDFSGQYKVTWSAETNLLYFIVEITDDVFVDGYEYNSDPSIGGGYPNYDIVEVFIDHDRSGGLHVFDGTGSTGEQWGTNAENAFSYHLTAHLPPDDQTVTETVVCDIAGMDWGNYYIPDYADHFPEFALKMNDGKYYWEFSLAVYSDLYDHADPEASRVVLEALDNIGLTLAYCDNDDPDENPKTRDNFIGSVWVPEEEYNDHWMNADRYGSLILMPLMVDVEENELITDFKLKDNYPNPFNPRTIIEFEIPFQGYVNLNIYDVLGRKIKTLFDGVKHRGLHRIEWNGRNNENREAAAGIYFYNAVFGNRSITKKMILLK